MNLVCPDCREPVEIIKACGCRDYFCNHCNQLVSKRRVIDLDSDEGEAALATQPLNADKPANVSATK